jgi:hypothetical protein
MTSDPETGGSPSEFDLDNKWYEAFADKVHTFGKTWPDALTREEEAAACAYADSIVRRPENERWDLDNNTASS